MRLAKPLTKTQTDNHRRERLWGIFNRKERWGLSLRGWTTLILVTALGFTLCALRIYPFLAVTHRVNADVLVVEGWVHKYAIRAAIQEFKTNSYKAVFTTGGPVEGEGKYTNDFNTSASVGADLLREAGLQEEFLKMVPSRVVDRDRTYGAAIALRRWLQEHDLPVHGVNVVTEDIHARRTRLLFEKALGPGVPVGVIAVPNPAYDPTHWWKYSEAVKGLSGETVGYLYARLLFHAPETKARTPLQGKTQPPG